MTNNIIQPISRQLIEKELSEGIFVRDTNNGNNEIYITDAHKSPNIMLELGRLREITFREAGGGTGNPIDIDEFDTMETPYKQLFVWNPSDKEIVGGYRFIECRNAHKLVNSEFQLATAELFHFSDLFIENYLPYSIELGRSFVQPEYQPTLDIRKGIYALDNIWDGLGAIIIDHPHIKYFFGKITMYPKFNIQARDSILYFLHKYFPDPENLVYPKIPLVTETDPKLLKEIFSGDDYHEDFRILVQQVRLHKENIPPLVNVYMNLSSTMKTFGTALNPGFGSVEETAIIISIDDIYDIKKDRHLSSYKKRES